MIEVLALACALTATMVMNRGGDRIQERENGKMEKGKRKERVDCLDEQSSVEDGTGETRDEMCASEGKGNLF